MKALTEASTDTAKRARCRYIDDSGKGIRRERQGRGFRYLDINGRKITAPRTLERIASLAIPPAWTHVWICPSPQGHIQATGRDARGRKQYRYHTSFRRARAETKFHRVLAFAEVLPLIRRKVDADMQRRTLDREKVLATIVRLLETSLIRIGHDEYTRENGSFGLTTLEHRHVDIRGSTIHFHFRGKSGQNRVVDVHDQRLARILQRCNDLPGEKLFRYIDDNGAQKGIEASDVNGYLRDLSGADFTAKDFRTWAGTVGAAHALEEIASAQPSKHDIAKAVATTAKRLGNTAAVCRNCYVHPAIFDMYLDGTLLVGLRRKTSPASDLFPHEAAVLALLRNLEARAERA